MAGILDILGLGGGDVTAEQAATPVEKRTFAERLMSQVPGGQYLTPEQSSGALGLALMQGGGAALMASAPRMDRPATVADAFGAGMAGFAHGLNQSAAMGQQGAYTGAKMNLANQQANAKAFEVKAKVISFIAQKNIADALANGQKPSDQDLMLADPAKALEMIYAQPMAFAKKTGENQQFVNNGVVTNVPGAVAANSERAQGEAFGKSSGEGRVLGPGESWVQGTPPASMRGGNWMPFSGPGGNGGNAPAQPQGGQGPQVQPQAGQNSAYAPFEPLVNRYAQDAGVDPNLMRRVLYAEGSKGDPNATSPKGARGIMQIMPDTAKPYGVDPTDPEQSAWAASLIMRDNLRRRGGNKELALMDYNWGPGNVDKWLANGADPNKVPLETRNYVATITGGKPPAQVAQQGGAYSSPAGGNIVRNPDGSIQNTTPPAGTPPRAMLEVDQKRYATLQEDADKAHQLAALGDQMKAALNNPGLYTGPGAQPLMFAKRVANVLGIANVDAMAESDLMDALTNSMGAFMRPAGSGATSDYEQKMFKAAGPGWAKTREGNLKMIELFQHIANRKQEVADKAREHIDTGKGLGGDFSKWRASLGSAVPEGFFGAVQPPNPSGGKPPLSSFIKGKS